MAAAGSPLRRWKPFFGAFASVDAAIEAADPELCRDEFRRARGDIVELLCACDATDDDDDDRAEQLCRVLDDVMMESLETLKLVPAMPKVLASTDLAKAVGALRKHESERVRVLATGIVRGWRASVEGDLVKVRAAMEKLDQLPLPEETTTQPAKILEPPPAPKKAKIAEPSTSALPKKTAPVLCSGPVKAAKMDASAKVSRAVGFAGGDRFSESDEKMESTKRKLHEGYQEAEEAKRQRKIQVVEAPQMVMQRQRKMHPIMRERSRARCGSSMPNRTFSVTRLHRV